MSKQYVRLLIQTNETKQNRNTIPNIDDKEMRENHEILIEYRMFHNFHSSSTITNRIEYSHFIAYCSVISTMKI